MTVSRQRSRAPGHAPFRSRLPAAPGSAADITPIKRTIRLSADVGTSYRSAIFYTSDEQCHIAEDTIADFDASGLWPGKAVTEIQPAGDFWEAEPEHQDYLLRNPGG